MAITTIPFSTRKAGPYTATAGQTVFFFGFPILAAADLDVWRERDGTATLLTEGIDYTVTGALDPAGGQVTLTSGAVLDDIIAIDGDLLKQRATSFVGGTPFQAATIDTDLNRLAIMMQELGRESGRSIRRSAIDPASGDLTLPQPIGDTTFLVLDAAGHLSGLSPVSLQLDGGALPVSTFAATLLDDLNALEVRTTLGAIGGSTGAIDNALMRADGTGGATLQSSGVIVDDNDNIVWSGGITQALTGNPGFFTDLHDAPNIARVDRLFVGAGALSNGNFFPPFGTHWLPTNTEGPGYLVRDAQLVAMSRVGQIGVAGFSRSSDGATAGDSPGVLNDCIGVAGSVINDGGSNAGTAWAGYLDVQHENATGSSSGIEINVKNKAIDVVPNPYDLAVAGLTSGIGFNPGADNSTGGAAANPVGVGILFTGTGEPVSWNSGIIFAPNSLTGTDGVTGEAEAMALAKGHKLVWYFAGGNVGYDIQSQVAATSDSQRLFVDSSGVNFLNNNSINNFLVGKVSGAVNGYLRAQASTGAQPELRAQGSATNIDLLLAGKGTGQVTINAASQLNVASGQIVFPGTQNAAAGANTLDDYEEGTWTPAVTFATPGNLSVTYSAQVGRYVKIGRQVFFAGRIITSAFTHTTASGLFQVTGLPFTAGVASIGGGVVNMSGYTKANFTDLSVETAAATSFFVNAGGSAQAATELAVADVPTGGAVRLYFNGHYEV